MKNSIIRMLAMIMCVAMLFAFCGCDAEDTGSIIDEDALNYADEVIDDLEDDGDTVTTSTGDEADDTASGDKKGDKTSSSNKGSSNKTSSANKTTGNKTNTTSNKTNTSGNKNKKPANTIDYGDKFGENSFEIDENKKQSFLESVPKSLSGQEVSILVWWQGLDSEDPKMKKFTEKTGIKIKWIYADMDNYLQRLATLRAQGNPPDIACIRVDDYPNAILLDYFRPLSSTKMNYTKDIYDVDSMNLLKFGGEHYGVTTKGTSDVTMGILAYNADIFDNAGVTSPQELWDAGKWTWDTFIKTCLDIQKATKVSPLAAGYSGYRLQQTSGEDAIAIKDGKLVNNMKSEVYREGYKFVSSLTTKGEYNVLIPHENMYDDFKNGQIAMIQTENWILQKGERLSDVKFTLGFAPLPNKTSKTVIPSDCQLWGFPTGSKHLEAATYVLEYWKDPQYAEQNPWMSDSAAGFMDWMWKQPKCFKVSQGVFDYGGEGSFWTYNFMVLEAPDKIDSYIDSQMSFVDANLKKIYETK